MVSRYQSKFFPGSGAGLIPEKRQISFDWHIFPGRYLLSDRRDGTARSAVATRGENRMKRPKTKFVRALTLGMGGLILGCQAPDFLRTGPAERFQPADRPATARVQSRESPPAEPAKKKTVLEGLTPADSLSACRPKGGGELTVARFLEELPMPEAQAPAETEDKPFQIPESIPGAGAPRLMIPERDPNQPFEEYQKQIRAAYEELPKLPDLPFSPGDQLADRISLAELQEIAYANSPVLPAAASRVEQARGRVIQAGLYPNPEVGYTAETINTADTAGYHGAFANQEIVTADKLRIAQTVACQDVAIAELELRQAEIDLATEVRRNYFKALIAQERLKLALALADLFERSYQAQIDLVAGGESPAYEPLQIRVFAVEARNQVIRAGNDYVAAWRALTAVLNAPHLEPRELAGSPEIPVPEISFEQALEILLARHTDLGIAQLRINRSQFDLNLQQVTPIPNVNLEGAVLYDDTSTLNNLAFNVQVGVPLPVFNRNQGNIYEAQSQIVEYNQRLIATRNELTAQLAEIYGRYSANRALARNYREEILPDQVRTYRGVYQQFRQGAGQLDFAQIIVTQQQLGQTVGSYVDVLAAQWRATIDLAELLQADDLFLLATPPSPHPAYGPDALLVPAPSSDERAGEGQDGREGEPAIET